MGGSSKLTTAPPKMDQHPWAEPCVDLTTRVHRQALRDANTIHPTPTLEFKGNDPTPNDCRVHLHGNPRAALQADLSEREW